MARRHPEDHVRYQQLLEATRDEDGICHRDEAVKLLTEELAERADRVSEYAQARANEVADGFDKSHQPAVDGRQMLLDIDTYLVIGENERVAVDDAKSVHTRQWLDVLAANHARVAAAWAAKDQHGRKLLAIQDQHRCSMWQAEKIFRNGGQS